MQNKEFPPELKDLPWYDSKWNITSQYKFILAFENSVFEDYVSEKLYHAFIVGSVPGLKCQYGNQQKISILGCPKCPRIFAIRAFRH
jgi:hypothetical protein